MKLSLDVVDADLAATDLDNYLPSFRNIPGAGDDITTRPLPLLLVRLVHGGAPRA
jgi:hypothetical protein